ncbi:uncharacterized protein [Zea mays]|uniref:uncharacterized protein n=1 Tax=Zea mays TaxID=4577 RepID=UPI0004DE8D83|nr:uncharacterized protein LOC103645653 [Zea mays]|eukprot:XP_008666891.1 uncharacterized protein LOC103645653 [Zea mays]
MACQAQCECPCVATGLYIVTFKYKDFPLATGSEVPMSRNNSEEFSTVATVIMVLGSSSRDETSFEATPWLESDCEDDFYSVNEDLTPAGSFASRTSGRNTPPPRPRDLPTLAVILKAEPLKPPPPQRRLGDLLREAQDDDNDNDTAVDGLSRDDSLRMGAEANRCCVPRLAWAISCNGRTQRK